MKKHIIIILLFISATVIAQKNTLYVSYKLNDYGVGLIYERDFQPIGVYTSLSYGNYRFPDGSTIKNHVETMVGVIKRITVSTDVPFTNIFSAGFSYSFFGDITQRYMKIPEKSLKKFSFNFGVGAKINHINTLLFYDYFKNELSISIGLNF